ncbi:uroporphyrinogen-III C-methyltransferase [Tunicatimonas pelagia]|uniref:uroporphyrinogen-III C-methyltransferase n=1 Tax=Tunicatimonas pelagia TaxID=931531 RepID=UPI0026653893|nr:uroporphyrinogen-III C-methyltransferase [Tunicatimonas pelagia]WKN45240.1 uroporphyrinogen-III C-methyltransferase [Tunicatimonas pelagia]
MINYAVNPRLTMVGAGPGDEELITLKGVRALEAADVVLYDALANPTLLRYCQPEALKIFVGKRAGLHQVQQRSINQLIVRYAYSHGHVVRLKGGDPFVFGRGQEEKEYAIKHGLEVTMVPGISSALAVPATNNIPLTSRGVSESFWVVTGTTRSGTLSSDMALAAQSSATVVILMGMRQLSSIIKLFSQHRGGDESIAIIQNGTCSNEQIGIGNLQSIQQTVREQKLQSPAIIVIGAVVAKHWESVQQKVAGLALV